MNKNSKNPSQVYYEMRNMVFSITAVQINLRPTNDLPSIYGILMETGLPETVVTLVALADGSVSLYFETGGGVIGAGEHENVQKASHRFLQTAEQFKNAMSSVKEFPLPDVGRVKFYVLTYEGVLSIDLNEEDLKNEQHILTPLFYAGHEVITHLKEIEEKR